MAKSAAAVASKWARRAAASEQDYLEGVASFDGDLADSIMAQVETMISNLIDSVRSGRFEAAVRANATTSKWKAAVAKKAPGRYRDGVAKSEDKMRDFMAKFLPKVQAIQDSLPPRGDKTANRARMNAMVDGLEQLKGTFKSM